MSARYHLVSLAAVLFALAAGVVLGAGPLAQAVNDTVTTPSTTADPSASVAAAAAQRSAVAYDEAAMAGMSGPVLAGRLVHQAVVLVLLPSTPRAVTDATRAALRAAGATVTGEVALTPAWADPDQLDVLTGITDQLAAAGTSSGADSAAVRSATALAGAVVASRSDRVGRTPDTSAALLAGLAQGGFLTTNGHPEQTASLALVLGPARTPSAAAYLPLVRALQASGRAAVVLAPRGSAAPGGIIAALRVEPGTRSTVSSVDCADLSAGRIAGVLALAAAVGGGHAQYGLGPGADAPFPKTVPTGG